MSFNTSLSGLNAASSELSVTSNNIANVGSTGFKGSRAEFADLYAVSSLGASQNAIGSGVLLAGVRQQFNQGNLEFTDNSLDLAINGRGFFVTARNPNGTDLSYTRSGAFGVNRDGYVVNSAGVFLQVFPVNTNGDVTSTSLSTVNSLRLQETFGAPRATTEVNLSLNLFSEAVPPTAPFDPADTSTYNHSTAVTVYDSLGNSHIAQLYYINTDPTTNTWETRTLVDTDGDPTTPLVEATPAGQTLRFDSSGLLVAPANGTLNYNTLALNNGANDLTLTFDYSVGTTQFASPFAVTNMAQDGNTIGRLTSVDISNDGVVRSVFSNGQAVALGKIALADFNNPEGLRQGGNTSWAETLESGPALAGEAGTGRLGQIQGGALESSNVELTEELVKLITAQRNFQANAKSIETSNNVTQTILNI